MGVWGELAFESDTAMDYLYGIAIHSDPKEKILKGLVSLNPEVVRCAAEAFYLTSTEWEVPELGLYLDKVIKKLKAIPNKWYAEWYQPAKAIRAVDDQVGRLQALKRGQRTKIKLYESEQELIDQVLEQMRKAPIACSRDWEEEPADPYWAHMKRPHMVFESGSIGEARPRFFKYLKYKRNICHSNLFTCGVDFDIFQDFFKPEKQLTEILTEDIKRFLQCDALLKKQKGRPRAQSTISRIIRVLRRFLNWAVETGQIAETPLPKKIGKV